MITDMDEPLGHAVGNALEIREAIATLRGEGPPDFVELVVEARRSCSRSPTSASAGTRRGPRSSRRSATALRWPPMNAGSVAQGGNPDEAALPTAAVVRAVAAPSSGYVQSVGAVQVGNAALRLGAGRRDKDDAIDHSVGSSA